MTDELKADMQMGLADLHPEWYRNNRLDCRRISGLVVENTR